MGKVAFRIEYQCRMIDFQHLCTRAGNVAFFIDCQNRMIYCHCFCSSKGTLAFCITAFCLQDEPSIQLMITHFCEVHVYCMWYNIFYQENFAVTSFNIFYKQDLVFSSHEKHVLPGLNVENLHLAFQHSESSRVMRMSCPL